MKNCKNCLFGRTNGKKYICIHSIVQQVFDKPVEKCDYYIQRRHSNHKKVGVPTH